MISQKYKEILRQQKNWVYFLENTPNSYSLLPCAHGNHACLRGDDCAAEMFFSLFYLIFIVVIRQFGLQNYIIISNCASFRLNFSLFTFHFSLFFVPLHPQKR